MFNIVLYQPEIPPNTGAIIRLCTNTGCKLHLIEPLGFVLDNKRMMRAGLDYIDKSLIKRHQDFSSYLNTVTTGNIYLCSTKATTKYTNAKYQPNDSLVFGPETRGLPKELLQQYPPQNKVIIPMHENGRSLNLAMAVAIISYEAWRQNDFACNLPDLV